MMSRVSPVFSSSSTNDALALVESSFRMILSFLSIVGIALSASYFLIFVIFFVSPRSVLFNV